MRRLLLALALSTAAAAPSAVAQDADSRFLFRYGGTVFEVQVPPEAMPPVWETSASLPGGTLGAAWSAALTATDDSGSVAYALQPGAPGWLSLNAATGLLSGTPGTVGAYAVTVRATDPSGNYADRTFTVEVTDVTPPAWQTAAGLPGGTLGLAWSATVAATDDSGSVAYALQPGAPEWLSLNAATGLLSGTPGAAGSFSVTVRAADPFGNYADRTFAVEVTDVTPPVWQTSASLPDGTLGAAWSATVTATDDSGSVTYALLPGAPGWLALNAATGLLSGTPDAAGDHEVAVRATDPSGNFVDRTFVFEIEVPPPFATISAGFSHTCGVRTDGSAWCWGAGGSGQLGNGGTADSAVPVQVSGGHAFVDVSAGSLHTCGVRTDGSAWCWGTGGNGQLGTGSADNSAVPVPVVN